MDFSPTEDQRLILEAVNGLADTLAPRAAEWDRADQIDPEAWGAVSEIGLSDMFLPENRGGSGLGYATGALAIEALARASGALALRTATHAAGTVPVLAAIGFSSDYPSVSGDLAWAARVDGIEAEKTSTGARLHGESRCVVGGADARPLVVVSFGGEVFVVEGAPDGLSRTSVEGLGMRGSGLAHIVFDGVPVPPAVGVLDIETLDRLVELEKVAVASVGVGLGRAALYEARRYALERKQFGRPIADFQAIQWMLADAATEVDAAGLLVLRAGLALDEGTSAATESRSALIFTSEAALSAAQKAIQIHGGYGFVREFPVERLARDARFLGLALRGRDATKDALGRLLLDDGR